MSLFLFVLCSHSRYLLLFSSRYEKIVPIACVLKMLIIHIQKQLIRFRKYHFSKFSMKGFFVGEKGLSGDLLGECRSALFKSSTSEIDPGGPDNTIKINTKRVYLKNLKSCTFFVTEVCLKYSVFRL